MSVLRLILADQLSHSLPSLKHVDYAHDVVMLCEVMAEATYVPHHRQKIAFLFSAMRHFAAELLAKGARVRYVTLDDPHNSGDLTSEIQRAISELKPSRIQLTEPGEYRVRTMMEAWQAVVSVPLEILPDTRFLATRQDFDHWARNKKELRMEFFYRDMRRKYAILLESDGKPCGGAWNFDQENRKPPAAGMSGPSRVYHPISDLTRRVLELVAQRFTHHFGTLENFNYAVTRHDALRELKHFITHRLPHFGDYQDAMVAGEPYLYHSRISSYLNAGLLLPLEICQQAEKAYRVGRAPLNAVEGFIRQILGWREYIRGIYWRFMPEYGQRNYLQATRPLPEFYWTAKTDLFCMAEAVRHTRDYAYSHHIQRLMITGNFALLAGLDVKQVQAWYLAVYADAYEWVEMPNTLGMALFGDGGVVASKPYAASGKYIQRMSNYCDKCVYDPQEMTGTKACPFNALYWDFIARHADKLRGNHRMAYVYSTWGKFTEEKKTALREHAQLVLQRMEQGTL
jgi:deoxyribodipyrimidine photolyase-related protein